MHFYYDYTDEIIGFEYFDGTTTEYYTYIKNMQGDVVAIIDSDGVIDTTYEYDAWGRSKGSSGGLDVINPIRYRGYYYDEEISMYYLQSRYYNPTVGRFINADDTDYIGSSKNMLSYNIFAYCENNPIYYCDYDGHRIQIHFPEFTNNKVKYNVKKVLRWFNKIGGKSYKFQDLSNKKNPNTRYEINYASFYDANHKPNKSAKIGDKLIWDLLSSKDYVVQIVLRRDIKKSETEIVSKKIDNLPVIQIRLCTNSYRMFTYSSRKKQIQIEKNIFYIGLAHELIHAERIIKGNSIRTDLLTENPERKNILKNFKLKNTVKARNYYNRYKTLSKKESIDELTVIGLINNYHYTENAIRAENNLNKRLSHFGEYKGGWIY